MLFQLQLEKESIHNANSKSGGITLFLAVVIPEGLNVKSSFITATLPLMAAIWTQVLPSCGKQNNEQNSHTNKSQSKRTKNVWQMCADLLKAVLL